MMTIYFLYPQLRKLTGAERLILKLADYVTKEGHTVHLVTHQFAESCRPALAPTVELAVTGRSLWLFRNHYLDAPLEYLLSVDLVRHISASTDVACFFGSPSLPGLWWARNIARVKFPCLYFCYEPPRFIYSDQAEIAERLGALGIMIRPGFWAYKAMDRWMVQAAEALLTNSPYAAGLVCQAYGREAQVITHGVDLVPAAGQAIESLRVKLGLQGRRVLLTVNYLHPRKRIDLLIRAMPYILQEVPQAVAVVVGSGPELDRLIKLRDEMNLRDKVVFAGFVNEEMLPAYYALSDVYVHTAKQESFGLSIIEAMAAGKPVVAVNEGGPRETVVDGETGFLIPAEPESLACCISDVLRDASLANTFGINGRWRVEKCYNWSIGAQTFIHVCYECIGQTKSRGGNR